MNLRSLIKILLREDLRYYHVSDASPENGTYQVEEVTLPNLRLSQNIELSDEEKDYVRNITWKHIIVDQGDYDGRIANMIITLPKLDISKGVVVDLQVINGEFYQPHIELADDLRGLGLGYKIYQALISDLGHLYSRKGRRQNVSEIPRIWEKLKGDPNMVCDETEKANFCVSNNNPDKMQYLKYLREISK